jgi:small subunit ribosomal protein S4
MARNTGPTTKIARRFGLPLFGSSKSLERKNYGPGQHGPRGGRRKLSDYAIALHEKQKLRHQYGVLERQFRRYFQIARTRRGVTGEILLQLLEARLDNVVFRMGLSNSRRGARQFVGHGHILVNGKKVDIASYNVREGDTISVKDDPKARRLASKNLELMQITPTPDWMTLDRENFTGQFVRVPSREEIAPIVNEQLIVELYSR